MSEVQYELKKSFDYAYKGENQTASFITLFAPNYKQMGNFTPIKQAFTAAITEVTADLDPEAAKDEAAKDDTGVTAAAAMQLMYRWTGDLTKIFLYAEQLFKSGAAMIDGEIKLTTPLLEKMDMVDVEGLLGEYIANFIAASLMDGQ